MNIIKKFLKKKKYYPEINKFYEKIKIIDSGHELIRIGANTDGGYLIPNILDKIEFCFSPGVGNSVSFEDHLQEYNIKCFLADGTVNYTGKHDFIKKNLNTFNDEFNITLDSWINEKLQLQNDYNDKLLLQMDIEGDEIGILYNVSLSTLYKFKIIIIEFHNFLSLEENLCLKIYNQIFDKILKTHDITHIHPNNDCITRNINDVQISDIYEITFINKKELKYKKKIKNSLPHRLDFPNKTNTHEVFTPEIFYK